MSRRALPLYFEVWIAARLLPFQLLGADLEQVLRLADGKPDPDYRGTNPERISKAVDRVTRWPILMRQRRCLRSAVVGFRLLRKTGLNPRLHFAVLPASLDTDATQAHCWVCLDSEPVINLPDPDMVEIFVYPKEEI